MVVKGYETVEASLITAPWEGCQSQLLTTQPWSAQLLRESVESLFYEVCLAAGDRRKGLHFKDLDAGRKR